MKNLSKLYINGQWVTPQSGDTLNVINPATEEVIASFASANSHDVEQAIAAAKSAFVTWSQTSSAERKAILVRIVEGMKARESELTAVVSQSMGCPEHIASWLQIEGAIYAMELFANSTELTEQDQKAEKCIIVKEPIGVCGFINPWNFPLHQFVGKVGAALAAGCTMVIKPSEQTPLQDYIMAEIFEASGLPAGVFNLVPGTGAVVGSLLSSHPDIDMVSFTGSTQAGIKVAQAAAPTVKRVMQELGGKSPFIITSDADINAAVTYGVEDIMLNSGQSCNTLARMIVPQEHYQKALVIAKEVAENLVMGTNEQASLGPMSSKIQQQRVREYIQIGIDEGATLLCGGLDLPKHLNQGYYVAPTIFADVNNKMRIAQEEIFGPVLCIIPYQNIEQAIEIANDTPYGLSSAVFAKDNDSAMQVARKIRSGQCMINGGEFNYHAPFGGYKMSGNGREFTHLGVEEFLETKAMITYE